MKNKTIKIYTLGRKVNQYDSGKLASKLAQAGFIVADKNADKDFGFSVKSGQNSRQAVIQATGSDSEFNYQTMFTIL